MFYTWKILNMNEINSQCSVFAIKKYVIKYTSILFTVRNNMHT